MCLRLAELVPALLLVVVPLSVHAGMVSALANLFAEDVVASTTPEYTDADRTARYTPLLAANVNADPLAIGGGDIAVEDGALKATGPVDAAAIAASPNKNGEISVYVVREGDSLSKIAEMYGVTTNTVLWANNLNSANDIHPGDTLVILPIEGVRHTVKKGETLSSIVKSYGADIEEVIDYNNLPSDVTLSVGDELIIPGGNLHSSTNVRVATAAPTKSSGSQAGSSWLSNPAPGSIKTQGIHGYNAVDLAGAYGSPIKAAAAGEVIVAKFGGWNGGYGNYVVIKHSNGVQTLYAHMSELYVAMGDYVAQGAVIGAMGSTGKSTGTHLHFEVRGGTNPF